MINFLLHTETGLRKATFYDINDFPYYKCRKFGEKLVGSRKNSEQCYVNHAMSFDIETTSMNHLEEPFAFVYHWQACVFPYCVRGRDISEFKIFLDRLKSEMNLSENTKMVFYCHNLSFEFQFTRNILEVEELFATHVRKVLKCTMNGIEFRCSYRLSNMSLKLFCENAKATAMKKDGDAYNYEKIRYINTETTKYELEYDYCDVYGLCECINYKLKDDNLYTIPLTSTGYVRRECRRAMGRNKSNFFLVRETKLNEVQYNRLKQMFRGGDSHASRYHANKILKNICSFDITSSYPFVIMSQYFPIGRFHDMRVNDKETFEKMINKYCCCFFIHLFMVRLKEHVSTPYIDFGHVKKRKNIVCDNGRIVSADYISIYINELDYAIIKDQYDIEKYYVDEFMYARRGMLPKEIREETRAYFMNKTTLKGIDEENYAKSKNLLNAIFGMMVSSPVHDEIFITDTGEWDTNKKNIAEGLEEYYDSYSTFLAYQWGCWITAHARYRLHEVISYSDRQTKGRAHVYNDTDSVKFFENNAVIEHIKAINKKIIEDVDLYDVKYYVEHGGRKVFMGVWEEEIPYYYFKTLGSKKYCYAHKDGRFEITVAGMSKEKGRRAVIDFDRSRTPFENFENGNTFENCGRTSSYYTDLDHAEQKELGGAMTTVGSSIAVKNVPYTVDIDDYLEFLEGGW